MVIKIAVIGSEKMADKVLRLNSHANVQIRSLIYDKPEESAKLVKMAQNDDVLFFTGPFPYFFAKDEIEKRGIPAVYIPLDELVFTVSLYYIRDTLCIHPDRLSIDIPYQEVVLHVLDELNIDAARIYIKEHEHYHTDEIVKFHHEQWKAGNVDFVLTSVQSVHKKLEQLGIPSFRMIIPKKNILDTLQHAVAKGELLLSQASQIAAGLVQIDYPGEAQAAGDTDLQAKLHELLLDLGKKMNASVKRIDDRTFMIYGTRGGIRQITHNYHMLPILDQLKPFTQASIRFGFGFGVTALESEEHAQIGLYHARKHAGHGAYIVTENKKVIGPLHHKTTKTFQLQSDDEHILTVAKQTGISVSSITKIIDFIHLRHNRIFSASDLADYLQLSKRSAERLLKKLVDSGYAEISGEEQPYQKGRPRALYKILL
ncbi:transcriptional regulator [Paenibacillus tyrfis]|uniref:transcriptional regulator n=1 Tax=Paenibacillus tyrfis TaxID=1501230 RepID=UPI00209DC1A1|nr:transcriptional regulator [Paenibacillus tyrfis]MCP1308169.1 transcriptional regulator [Paenibacillus tyrfis]